MTTYHSILASIFILALVALVLPLLSRCKRCHGYDCCDGGDCKADKLCSECGHEPVEKEGKCETCLNACPMCGDKVDDDTGICFTCKEAVR